MSSLKSLVIDVSTKVVVVQQLSIGWDVVTQQKSNVVIPFKNLISPFSLPLGGSQCENNLLQVIT